MTAPQLALRIALLTGGALATVACSDSQCNGPGGLCVSPSGGGPNGAAGEDAGASLDGSAGAENTAGGQGGAPSAPGGAGGSDPIGTPGCGDGWVDGAETCDDRNGAAADGCDACRVEAGWVCAGEPSRCTDIDECATNRGGCDPQAPCVNAPGSFSCGACPPGYLGDGTTGCAAATTIATNNVCACAIKTDATLLCWGTNAYGQKPIFAGTFKAVAAAALSFCAIRTDDTIACVGNDNAAIEPAAGTYKAVAGSIELSNSGLCGLRTDGSLRWMSGVAPMPGTFRAVSVGGRHGCALRMDGTVACWGSGDYGETWAPEETFEALALGWDYSCGIATSGAAVCWGTHAPPGLPGGAFTSLAAGQAHVCGIRPDETVTCWGDNSFGQATPPAGTFKALAVGALHSCGIRSDGKVTCWGGASDQSLINTPPDTFQVW
jgi:cysteine-rich repeat protein